MSLVEGIVDAHILCGTLDFFVDGDTVEVPVYLDV